MSRVFVAAFLLSLAVCLAASLASPARAERLGKGRSLVFVGIGGHTGEFIYPGVGGIIEFREVGGQVAYYRFLSDEWTLGISGGYHAGRLTIDENNPFGPG